MSKINDYLDGVLSKFKTYVKSGEPLCDLKDVRFNEGNLPDYSNINCQRYYLLRYAYAYAFEYKQMYKKLMGRIGNVDRISIASIGCGNAVDYWALTQVVPENCNIRYVGIDVIDWADRFEPRQQDEFQFVLGDANGLFDQADELISDVYIFPKSISEFTDAQVRRIGNNLANKLVGDKKVYLLFSLRSDQATLEQDKRKTAILYNSMIQNGYVSPDDSDYVEKPYEKDPDKKIREADADFEHPTDVVNFLKEELYTCCINYTKNGKHCKDNCKDRLTWMPILSCKQVRWQLFEFYGDK